MTQKSTSKNENSATNVLLVLLGRATPNHQSLLFQSGLLQDILASGKGVCGHAKDVM